MIIQPDFLTHWKVQALSGIIGRAEALTALLALWGHCQNSKTYVFEFTLPMLAGICQYQGDAAQLHRAMLDCRLLDPLENGRYEVHGWAEKNASYQAAWSNGAKGGKPKNPQATERLPSGNPAVTHGLPTGEPNTTIQEPTGPPKEGIEGRKEAMKEGMKESAGPPDSALPPTRISWSHHTGWSGFTPELRETLAKAFPGLDLDLACNESDAWLRLKPANANKKNWFTFLTNWLRRSSPSLSNQTDDFTSGNDGKKNEGGAAPPALSHHRQPDGPWRGAFEATYGRLPDGGWATLPPAIQREIRTVLAEADALLLASFEAAEKNERGEAA